MAELTRFGFGQGVMSADFAGRVDVDHYHRSCAVLENMEVLQSGAVRRRCGSRFLTELPLKPLAMDVFLWSNGVLGCVIVYGSKVEVRDREGVLLFGAGYAAGSGVVRLLQINDLVVVVNSAQMPYMLKNVGGVFSFSQVAWKGIPMEGNWARSFALRFHANVCRVASRWDVFSRISNTNQCYSAQFGGVSFFPGQMLAVRYLLGEASFTISGLGFTEVALNVNHVGVGNKVAVKLGGTYTYWTCVQNWAPRAEALDPGQFPDFFEAGVDCWSSPVSGGYELRCKGHGSSVVFEVQQFVGGRWMAVLNADLSSLPSDDHIFTGDMGGDSVRLRVALVSSSAAVSPDIDRKVVFRRKAARVVMYLSVQFVYDDGSFRFSVVEFGDWFSVKAVVDWDVQAFSAVNGFPSCVAFHGGRLVFAGTVSQPQTLWFSAVDDFFNFMTGGGDADAMVLTLSGSSQSRIVWASSSGSSLLVGTTAGEVVIRAGGNSGVLSASSAVADNHSFCGSVGGVDVLMTTDALMFLDRSGRRLRRLSYSVDSDLYFARDMSVFSYGILSGGAVSCCWQRSPQPVAWMVPESGVNGGNLVGMLYNPDQQISSWFVWGLGAPVLQVCCTGTGRDVDPLFVCVKREKVGLIEPPDPDPGEPDPDPNPDPDPGNPDPPEPPKVPVEVVKDWRRHEFDLNGHLYNWPVSFFYFSDENLFITHPAVEGGFGGSAPKQWGWLFHNKLEGSGYYRVWSSQLYWDTKVRKWTFNFLRNMDGSIPAPLNYFFDLPGVMVPGGHNWCFKAFGGWKGKLHLQESNDGVNYWDRAVYASDVDVSGFAHSQTWFRVRLYGYSRRDGHWAGLTCLESWRTEIEYVDAARSAGSGGSVRMSRMVDGVDDEVVMVPMYCLEVLDWVQRDMDSEGNGEGGKRFVATVLTNALDQPQFFGKRGAMPLVDLLVDGVDLAHAEVCSGGNWCACSGRGMDGWVSSVSLSNGGYVRAVGMRFDHGHGVVMAGRVRNGD